ncbi:M1 family metallopeptidase [Flavobacteriaceae bacterium GF1]
MRYLFPVFLLLSLLCFSQRQKSVDFIKADAKITPSFSNKTIKGWATYEFDLISRTDSIFLDAVNMTFEKVELNGKKIKYSNSNQRIGVKAPRKLGNHLLELTYSVKPNQAVYFTGWDGLDSVLKKTDGLNPTYKGIVSALNSKLLHLHNRKKAQIWTQGQGKYTSHWLPSIDDMNDKIEFDFTITADREHTVISNGRLTDKTMDNESVKWHFDMNHPMSSYLAAFVIGSFDKKVIQSHSGVPIELYYVPKDSLKVEPTYRYTKELFDFLEEEIGVPYPWQNYKQVPVQDFLYAGMENTSCTVFSNQYVVDSIAFVDKNYVNVNAHELVHQWFGNMVTEVSGKHHWLHEGFATFYAYLAEKEVFGEDYFYWKLYQTAKTLHNLSENEGGEALTDPNANSLTFYEKGAWALAMLREEIGEVAFRKGIKAYLEKYAFMNVTIDNFLTEMEGVSGLDLTQYRERWLESEEFPWQEVKAHLKKANKSLKLFLEMEHTVTDTTIMDEQQLALLKENGIPEEFKRQFIFTYGNQIPDSSLSKIIANTPLRTRQAVALAIPKVSKELQSDFERMLTDQSYVTQETVLFKLWSAFPKNRGAYLDQLDGVVGLPNKNVRLLWLTLALLSEDYQPESKKSFYDELNGYTASHFNFEVRQLAFQYLHQIRALNDVSLRNLVQACDHHIWQFKKSSRKLIREINALQDGKNQLLALKGKLSEKERRTLKNVLSP